MDRRPLRPLSYYLDQVPKDKEYDFNSLEEAIESYKAWKQSVSDFYTRNEEVKQEDPVAYECLIETDLTDKEIKRLTADYYKEEVIFYSESLLTDEYELA